MKLLHADVTEKIIGAFYRVHGEMGFGFLERVYKLAMLEELRSVGLRAVAEKPINVYYRGVRVGEYYADLVVEDCVIVELKSVKELAPEHIAQIINYLKATRYEVGLLMNFGLEAKYVRKAYINRRKGSLNWTPDFPSPVK